MNFVQQQTNEIMTLHSIHRGALNSQLVPYRQTATKCDHYSLYKWQLRHDSTYTSNVNSWDTDSNKSYDFLLNPICIVVLL